MRISAGSAKGRLLKSPKKGSEIKPILGRVRQSLFDTLRPWVVGSHFLDLYAGSGTVGLEALSRGASFVCFVDKGREALRLVDANVKRLGFEEKALIYGGDILGGGLWMLKTRLPREFSMRKEKRSAGLPLAPLALGGSQTSGLGPSLPPTYPPNPTAL